MEINKKRKKEKNKKRKRESINFGNKKKNSFITPLWIKSECERIFNIKLSEFDPCPLNRLDPQGLEINGLAINWKEQLKDENDVIFINPPYNQTKGEKNGIKGFLIKALEEYASNNVSSIFLIPFRPSNYFFDLIVPNVYSYFYFPSSFVKFIKESGEKYEHAMPITMQLVFFKKGTDTSVLSFDYVKETLTNDETYKNNNRKKTKDTIVFTRKTNI